MRQIADIDSTSALVPPRGTQAPAEHVPRFSWGALSHRSRRVRRGADPGTVPRGEQVDDGPTESARTPLVHLRKRRYLLATAPTSPTCLLFGSRRPTPARSLGGDWFDGAFDQIMKRFRDLLLELFSSSSGRLDLGMIRHVHWIQLTDNWPPALTPMSLARPAEQCMIRLGAISPGTADLHSMLRIGLLAHFGVSRIFPTRDEVQHVARWRHTVEFDKTFARPILPTCRVFPHTPIQRHTELGDERILEHAPDASRACAGLFRVPDTFQVFPRGVSAGWHSKVIWDSSCQSYEISGRE